MMMMMVMVMMMMMMMMMILILVVVNKREVILMMTSPTCPIAVHLDIIPDSGLALPQASLNFDLRGVAYFSIADFDFDWRTRMRRGVFFQVQDVGSFDLWLEGCHTCS